MDRNAPKWNFEEPYVNKSRGVTDAASREREPVRPDVELARYREVNKLRRLLEDGCRKKLFMKCPKMALERWLIEQAQTQYRPTKENKMDPLLRNPRDAGVVRREIEYEIPKRIFGMRQRKDIERLKQNVDHYCVAARAWMRRLKDKREAFEVQSKTNGDENEEQKASREDADKKEVLNAESVEEMLWEAETKTREAVEDLRDAGVTNFRRDHEKQEVFEAAEIIEAQLIRLRDVCSPLINKMVKPVLDELMNELETTACEACERLWEMRHKERADGDEKVTLYYPQGYRNRFRVGAPVTVRYGGDQVFVTTGHVLKLRSLYVLRERRDRDAKKATAGSSIAKMLMNAKEEEDTTGEITRNNNDDDDGNGKDNAVAKNGDDEYQNVAYAPDGFLDALYTILRRYTTFIANAGQMQAAAPEEVFEAMREDFSVCMESFGSPLNCYFQRMGSAFPDIDVYFGSVGSFFRNEPTEGSFETGPPYVKETMDEMALRLDMLLDKSEGPLSFIVFVPDWYDPPLQAKLTMEASPYLRADLVANGRKHGYVVGNQHTPASSRRRYYSVPHGTHLYWLQNDAGFEKWRPTKKKLQRVLDGLERCQIDSDIAAGRRYDNRDSAGTVRLFHKGKVVPWPEEEKK